jgi:hypothetical protein
MGAINCGEFLDWLRNCRLLKEHFGPLSSFVTFKLKVCKSVHHHMIQINQSTRCSNFSNFITWRLCTAQHVSGVLMPIIRSSPSAVAASGFTAGACWSWAGQTDHDQQHCYHHAAPTAKPEAATAAVELLMMGVRMPETCWAVHKCQVINLWVVVASGWLIYLNCIRMFKTESRFTNITYNQMYPFTSKEWRKEKALQCYL